MKTNIIFPIFINKIVPVYMLECAQFRCGRLKNMVTCPSCLANFHVNCLTQHSLFCNPEATMVEAAANFTNQPILGAQLHPRLSSSSPSPNLQPLNITEFQPSPGLPDNWETLAADEKTSTMMRTLIEVRHQNYQIKQDITAIASEVNYQSQVIATHDFDLHRISAEQSDLQHAHSDRNSKAESIVSGLPKDIALPPKDIVIALFKFLDFEDKYA